MNYFIKILIFIAIKTDDPGKSKFLPHRIELVLGAQPIKQKNHIEYLNLSHRCIKTRINNIN